MKTVPIRPARIEFGDSEAGDPPRAPDFGDLYHPRIGAAAQARHVFLQANGLPGRWAGRARFTILETGFGLGNNFLATWDAWRSDPRRCGQLHYVALELHPPRPADLALAHAASPWPDLAAELRRCWPPAVANLHPIEFDAGRVRLVLALGDANRLLPALNLAADAVYLDGFAPALNPQLWTPRLLKALGRKLAAGATAATWSVAREVRDGLTSAGFEVGREPGIGGKREITVARWAPRFVPRRLPPLAAGAAAAMARPRRADSADSAAPDALVVGAGLAGAAAAQSLARLGGAVTVFDRHPEPAAETSGNAGGLFHGTVHEADGIHARLFRAAALVAQREYAAAVAAGVPGQAGGLLRLDGRPGGVAAMQATLRRLGLPPDHVLALAAAEAGRLAGLPLAAPAWFFAGGGWIDPAAWVRHALATPGVLFAGSSPVAAIERHGGAWRLLGADGSRLGEAAILVLANAADAVRLLVPPGVPPWPLEHSRGQVTLVDGPTALRLPVAGDGYALPLPDGRVLCGATSGPGVPGDDPRPLPQDHRHNLDRLQRLTGLATAADPATLQGRVGWRLGSTDRLPVAGAVPVVDAGSAGGRPPDQVRLLPRQPGLFVVTALGGRGLTLAPLLGRLVAAMATGTPWPLEQDLADAVDPGRWIVRRVRAAASQAESQAD